MRALRQRQHLLKELERLADVVRHRSVDVESMTPLLLLLGCHLDQTRRRGLKHSLRLLGNLIRPAEIQPRVIAIPNRPYGEPLEPVASRVRHECRKEERELGHRADGIRLHNHGNVCSTGRFGRVRFLMVSPQPAQRRDGVNGSGIPG